MIGEIEMFQVSKVVRHWAIRNHGGHYCVSLALASCGGMSRVLSFSTHADLSEFRRRLLVLLREERSMPKKVRCSIEALTRQMERKLKL